MNSSFAFSLALRSVGVAFAYWIGAMSVLAASANVPAVVAPNVALYYGKEPPWDELRAFDLVVLDHGHDLQLARGTNADAGTKYLAHLSVGEVHPTRGYLAELPPAWQAGKNDQWGSIIVDQSVPEWPEWFVERIARPAWDAGYRGFFLDTLDSYQLVATSPVARAAQEAGLVRVIEGLKAAFPEAKLILNRGFEILPRVAQHVTMVAGESLYQRWDANSKTYTEVPELDRAWLQARMDEVRTKFGLPILAIEYVAADKRELARSTARRIEALGYVPWVATVAHDSLGVGAIEVMSRKVLVVFNKSVKAERLAETVPFRYAAMPLNYLGYVPVFHDLDEAPLPSYPLSGRFAGVVMWLSTTELPAGAKLARWLERATNEGVPVAVMGDFGVGFDELPTQWGLTASRTEGNVRKVEVAYREGTLIGFEVEPLIDRSEFFPLKAAGSRVLLRLRNETNGTMDAIAFTPWGGYATHPYRLIELPEGRQGRWIVNPIEFLRTALRLPGLPVPDVTTETGRRILMVHMDGDGFASRAEMPGTPWASEVVLREVFERYRVPTTVSVIEGEVSGGGLYPGSSAALESIARRIFALGHVEAASHSFSHPFSWRDAQAEPAVPDHRLPIPKYQFDLKREIEGSARYINERLLPPGKRTELMLWTGDCDPSDEAMTAAASAGLLNMNGGDTVITDTDRSITLVAPIGVFKGKHFQVYAPNQNENVYTNLWRGPFYGYERVLQTFQLTDAPYRLKPINIYFHTYSASKVGALNALHKVYQYAMAQPHTSIFSSEYVRKALDFNRAVVARSGDAWLIRATGSLRQFRVPESAGRPDLAGSQGVAGYNQHHGQVYLHAGKGDVRVAFAERPSVLPYVVDANAQIDVVRREGREFVVSLNGSEPIQFTLANAAGCKVSSDGAVLAPATAPATSNLSFGLKEHGRKTITIRCGE